MEILTRSFDGGDTANNAEREHAYWRRNSPRDQIPVIPVFVSEFARRDIVSTVSDVFCFPEVNLNCPKDRDEEQNHVMKSSPAAP